LTCTARLWRPSPIPRTLDDMTNTVADERRRLHDRLLQLDDERAKITFALGVLDRIEPEAATSRSAVARASRADRVDRSGTALGARRGGTLEHAVRVVNATAKTWRVEELVPAMRADGWTAQVESDVETVRSALSRAVRDGLISRISQGVYGPLDRGDGEADKTGTMTGPTGGVGVDTERGTDPDGSLGDPLPPAVPAFADAS
jgi:hypothetical protein